MPTAKSLVEFYPVGDNILVEVIEEDKETDSEENDDLIFEDELWEE